MKLAAPGWTIPENATIELGYICWYDSANHTYQWRHCKRHQRITSELVEKIQAA